MKHFLYLIVVILLVGGVILTIPSQSDQVAAPGVFITNLVGRAVREGNQSRWEPTKTLPQQLSSDTFVYTFKTLLLGVHQFAPTSDEIISFEQLDQQEIFLSWGTSIIVNEDPSSPLKTILTPVLKLTSRGPGTFFLKQSNNGDWRIYSFDAFADVVLLDTTGTPATSILLHPGILFVISPQQNDELREADFLRVATLQNLLYVNPLDSRLSQILLAEDNVFADRWMTAVIEDLRRRHDYLLTQRTQFATLSLQQSADTLEDLVVDPTLKNPVKLQSLYLQYAQDILIETFQRDKEKQAIAKLKKLFDDVRFSDSGNYEKLKTFILPKFVLTFPDTLDSTLSGSALLDFGIKQGFLSRPDSQDAILSRAFARALFTLPQPNTENLFRASVSSYLASLWRILAAEGISSSESLARLYASTDYAIREVITPDVKGLEATISVVDAGSSYYTATTKSADKSSIAALLFGDATRTLSALQKKLIAEYFASEEPLVLKAKYLSQWEPNLPSKLTDTLDKVLLIFSQELESKKENYYRGNIRIGGQTDAYVSAIGALKNLQKLRVPMSLFQSAGATGGSISPPASTLVRLSTGELQILEPRLPRLANSLRMVNLGNGTSAATIQSYTVNIASTSYVYRTEFSGTYRPLRQDWYKLTITAYQGRRVIRNIILPLRMSAQELADFSRRLPPLLDTLFARASSLSKSITLTPNSVIVDGVTYPVL